MERSELEGLLEDRPFVNTMEIIQRELGRMRKANLGNPRRGDFLHEVGGYRCLFAGDILYQSVLIRDGEVNNTEKFFETKERDLEVYDRIVKAILYSVENFGVTV